ncbi:MAG: PIG-L family deacetylase [Chloroflexi bacterium]|nr:PIG-L family deacetylase [Chloroflexota bacterium]MCL4561664.1 PIG-L family deacetylase [Chloroflexota bacterium]
MQVVGQETRPEKEISQPQTGMRLLAVLAHPDDETFGMGGTLALYARKGAAVYLACATRGELGDVEPEMLNGFRDVGHLRETELRCAAQTLGLAGVEFLGYRDSGMAGSPENQSPGALAAAPLDEVASRVAQLIRKLRPQVVLTFDPIGGYRHPDHIAIHNATVKAFYAAGNSQIYPDGVPSYTPQRLYFQVIPRRMIRVGVSLLRMVGKDPRHFGKNGDVDLTALMAADYPVNVVVDYGQVRKQRDAAAACHASQGGGALGSGIQGMVLRLIRPREMYMQAYPEPANGRHTGDLFTGVSLDV